MLQQQAAVRWWAFVIFVCVALVLAGCGEVDSEVVFKPDERWSARVDMTLNPSEVAAFGGATALEARLKEQLDPLQRLALESRWSKDQHSDGSVTYHLSLDGKGYASLNQALFNNQAAIRTVTQDGQRQIHFSYTALSAGVRRFGLRLTGGRIVSSNADEVRGGTAIWRTWRGSAEAVLTEASGLPDLALILGGGALALVLGLVLVLVLALAIVGGMLMRRKGGEQSGYPAQAAIGTTPSASMPLATRSCPNCGATPAPGAIFCGRCGTRLQASGGR